MKVVATGLRIYADDAGKFQISPEWKGDVAYGGSMKAVAAFLYSEGLDHAGMSGSAVASGMHPAGKCTAGS